MYFKNELKNAALAMSDIFDSEVEMDTTIYILDGRMVRILPKRLVAPFARPLLAVTQRLSTASTVVLPKWSMPETVSPTQAKKL